MKIRESAKILEALQNGASGEKVFKVVLITEGLGNRRNMNFYGPEAITSAAKVYEGKCCYINHQSADEEENLPERDIRDKAGYFKNLKVEEVDGVNACVGELHCDLSESGRFLAEKVQSALLYKKEFPNSDSEYCGFSVNGDGDAEKKELDVDGETINVNYVNSFTENSDSCDLVTTPARGGKAVSALRESEVKIKESIMKNVKKMLEAAFKAITESSKKVEDKKPLLEAGKSITEAIKAVEAEDEKAMESEAVDSYLAKREGEAEEDHVARMQAIKKAVDEMLQGEKDEQPQESEDEGCVDGEPPAAKPQESAKPLTADELERNQIAVKFLIKESGLPEDCYSDTKLTDLAKMPFAKAKGVIESDAKLAASIMREAGVPVASLRRATKESAGGNKAAFTESFKENK